MARDKSLDEKKAELREEAESGNSHASRVLEQLKMGEEEDA